MTETKSYNVKDLIDPQQLRSDLEINQFDLSFSMMRQAGLFAYYSECAAKAERQLDQLEQMKDVVEARLDKMVRDRAVAEGTKITEAQVKAQITLDPKMIAIRTAVNKAKMIASLCKSAADSFRHRRDMLIQMSFNAREEGKGQLRTYEDRQASSRESLRERAAAFVGAAADRS